MVACLVASTRLFHASMVVSFRMRLFTRVVVVVDDDKEVGCCSISKFKNCDFKTSIQLSVIFTCGNGDADDADDADDDADDDAAADAVSITAPDSVGEDDDDIFFN